MTENITHHTNALQKLFNLLTNNESIDSFVYYPFLRLLVELSRAISPEIKETMKLLSTKNPKFEDYEKLADLIEQNHVACDEQIKKLVIGRLRGLRNRQDQYALADE